MVAKKNDLSLNTREQGTMRKNRAVDFGHDTLTTFDLNEAQFKAQVYCSSLITEYRGDNGELASRSESSHEDAEYRPSLRVD